MHSRSFRTSHIFIGAMCLLLSTLATGCITEPQELPMAQSQIRDIQTRFFDTSNTKAVMKAMLNVLQDEGYFIHNANLDLGLISASKNEDLETSTGKVLRAIFSDPNDRFAKIKNIEVSANVSAHGEQTKVRVSFQTATKDNAGATMNTRQILEQHIYQDFYTKVSKSIFFEEAQL